MAEGKIIEGKIIVDHDEGSIYLPPELKEYIGKYGVLTWSEGWFDGDKKCHLVSLGDKKKPPKYCERKKDVDCVCCPQCCTCGG